MNRRQLLSVLGTAGVGAAGISVAYLADQGVIDVDEAAVSGRADQTPASFEFDATAGETISITIRERQEADSRGSFTLTDPNGERVVSQRLSLGETTHEVQMARIDGTYTLGVSPAGGRYSVSVTVNDAD